MNLQVGKEYRSVSGNRVSCVYRSAISERFLCVHHDSGDYEFCQWHRQDGKPTNASTNCDLTAEWTEKPVFHPEFDPSFQTVLRIKWAANPEMRREIWDVVKKEWSEEARLDPGFWDCRNFYREKSLVVFTEGVK